MAAIDLNDEEVISFLRSLQYADVKYLLVGAFAVSFHGYVRATHDLDMWLKDDSENVNKFRQVLTKHGVAGLENVRSFDLAPGFAEFRIGQSGFVLDPMKSLKAFTHVDFDSCYSRAESGEFNGVRFKVINAKDLLKEKEATNKPTDQGDIGYLKSIN